jgi:hypothetical protein
MNLEKIVRFGKQFFQEKENGTFAEIEKQAIVKARGHSALTLIKKVDKLPEVSAKTENNDSTTGTDDKKESTFAREDLVKLKREQLDEIAVKLGVEPSEFKNNFSLIKAIQTAQKV